jgi:endonuclease/exonuclease/phosphatase family metal-dependent hydrolase
MRLVSYNILDGGEGREKILGDVIDAQRPDLVGLVEADNRDVVERLAIRLKMDFVHAPGNAHASALLSRWPVRESINHAVVHPAKLEKSLLEAVVVDPVTGTPWTVGVVHLHAHGTEEAERKREQELEVVLRVFETQRLAGSPHVICGDFNANAPYQRIDPKKCKPRTQREWQENGGGLPRRVVQRILDAGYKDSLREVDPAASETKGTFTTEFPGQRVDYLFTFAFDRPKLKKAWIASDPPAKDASDHYPVGAEIA